MIEYIHLRLLSDTSLILEELIAAHPLNTDDITKLFDLSDRYVIPYLQTNVKRYGLVLFNTENREGAESEAKTMGDCLVKAGFHTKMKEWNYPHELFVEISEPQITELVTILSSLRSSLPGKIPLVSSLKNSIVSV